MRTLLSQFCEEFDGILRPLLPHLERSAESLEESQKTLQGFRVGSLRIQPRLVDVRHSLGALVDKVAEQQAYVLIFGPLKSGKSTLMNAVSAAYVSEVTSLPAYPCMVYLGPSDEKEITFTRYNGDTVHFVDPATMRGEIDHAHAELGRRIREVEAQGEDFDPAVHFREAIRRVDIRVPAGELEKSGAVLVDTPGLYSRMKFGYDRMTREFRNSAACAIFVVKTDNLFLEQVFDEFNDLLDLFSRIFLVVNLDTTKQDLQPDGSLAPSLEQSDPDKLIQAFENLAMSAPLKKAADEGRLRIYPVDLLRAASKRLGGDAGGGKAVVAGEERFRAFLDDLSQYLNSTEYLTSFLGDSLRQARSYLDETMGVCRDDAVTSLARDAERREHELGALVARREAVERLQRFDWGAAFTGLQEELGEDARRSGRERAAATRRHLDEALAKWFETDASLHTLQHGTFSPLLEEHQRELAAHVHGALGERVRSGDAGLNVPAQTRQDLVAAGIDLAAVGRRGLEGLDAGELEPQGATPLTTSQVPVRKGFADWVLFRGQAAVARTVLGPADRPDAKLPKAVKQRRLGEPAQEAMRRGLDEFAGRFFPETSARLRSAVLGDYAHAASAHVASHLERLAAELAPQIDEKGQRLKDLRRVLNHIAGLETELQRASDRVEELSGRYVSTDPDLLVQPIGVERRLPRPANIPDLTEEPAANEPAAEGALREPHEG